MKTEITLTIIAGIITIIGWFWTKYKEINMRLIEQRSKIYEENFNDILDNIKSTDKEKLSKAMINIKKTALIWGDKKTITNLTNWQNKFSNINKNITGMSNKKQSLIVKKAFGNLIRILRREFGHKDWFISDLKLAEGFIN